MPTTASNPPAVPALPDLRWISWTCWILILGSIGSLAFQAALNFAGPQPFRAVVDDSLMLVRYADNLLKYGAMIWNPGGPPTYGLTSPYYFLCAVLPIREFVTSSPIGVAVWSSLSCGILFFCAIPVLIYRFVPGPNLAKHVAMAAVFLSLAWSAPHMIGHLLSGMDACFGLLYFMIYLAFLSWYSYQGTAASGVLTGVIAGLAFGARPDLVIYSLLIPVGLIVFARDRQERPVALGMLAATLLTLGAQAAFANVYFQSPLPLSFYAKSLKLYPGLAGYGFTSLYSLCFFVASYWLLFVLIVLNATVDPRQWWRETTPLAKSLLAALLVHLAYVLLGVTPIMGQNQRFFYADLPVLIYLSATATVRLLDRVPASWSAGLGRLDLKYRYAAFAAAFFFPLPTVTNVQTVSYLLHGNFAPFDLVKEYQAYNTPYWFALDRFSTLPDDLRMAVTEIGHVAAMNLNKEVVDFSGLNETRFAHHRFSAEVFFQHYHPDLIVMPHPGYRGMVQDLENHPVFKTQYVWVPPEDTGDQGTGLAIRRDSKYYDAMRKIFIDACDHGVTCRLPPEISGVRGSL